jgi:hypothetical protein
MVATGNSWFAVEAARMEPENRRYVDPDMDPGDKGTEAWADDDANDDPTRGPLAEGRARTDAEGAIIGSPADIFDDGDAIAARNDEG